MPLFDDPMGALTINPISVSQVDGTLDITNRWEKYQKDNHLFRIKDDKRTAKAKLQNQEGLVSKVLEISNQGSQSCFFLPYRQNAGVFIDFWAPPEPSPTFFVTTALNGCAVFIAGTPQFPVVYHFNAEAEAGSLGDLQMPEDAAQFKQRVNAKLSKMINHFKIARGVFNTKLPEGRAKLDVGGAHYISAWDYLGPAVGVDDYNSISTRLKTKYKLSGADILNRHGEVLLSPTKIGFISTGVVVGCKKVNSWAFYLQTLTIAVMNQKNNKVLTSEDDPRDQYDEVNIIVKERSKTYQIFPKLDIGNKV